MSDIHGYSKALERLLDTLRTNDQILDANKLHILKFEQQCAAEGIQPPRIVKYVYTLSSLSRMFGNDFEKITKPDMIRVVEKIERNDEWGDWTKRDYKVALKKFFKWLRDTRGKSVYPEEVAWLNTTKGTNHVLPEEILTEEEIKKLTEAASHPRDKALVQVIK